MVLCTISCVYQKILYCVYQNAFWPMDFCTMRTALIFFMNEMKFECRNYGKSISIVLNEMLWMYQMSIIYWNLPIMSWIIDAPLISNEKCILCHHLFRCICKQIIDCTLQIIFEIQLFLIRLHSMFIHTIIHTLSFWTFISKCVHWYDFYTMFFFYPFHFSCYWLFQGF